MDLQLVGRGRPVLVALVTASAIAVFALIVSMMGVRTAQATSASTTTTLAPVVVEPEVLDGPAAGLALVPDGGVQLWGGRDSDPQLVLHEGVVLPFLHRSGEWLLVTTMCNESSWVNVDDVEVIPQVEPLSSGPGFDLSSATIVLDPGHGARDWGGVGPSGLSEKEVNLDIADRARKLMESSNSVDWSTGAVTPGAGVPAFKNVFLTRDLSGPNDGDYELGLGYRVSVATAAGADAFVSIHNNTVPRIDTDIPGSEVYYSTRIDGSDRLAGIIYEELLRSFSQFTADWSGGELQGARSRVDPETGDDYYGLLRRATMPAVIVEGVYISEPEEEALLATTEFRQAYAEAVYRGVVRYLTTADPGSGINRPEVFYDNAGTVSGNGCTLSEQP
ncbi:MAG: N-acetylmuramoyl-L-alanine amidase [Acidimicrobiia bacterium]|nr:N-acetylmuramoyl-L-alanine amidase [Acidimicrobiia bacterium]